MMMKYFEENYPISFVPGSLQLGVVLLIRSMYKTPVNVIECLNCVALFALLDLKTDFIGYIKYLLIHK